MDDIALMQETPRRWLGGPVPQMGISTAANAPGSDPGDSSSNLESPAISADGPGGYRGL
jgi:hypothetical protein